MMHEQLLKLENGTRVEFIMSQRIYIQDLVATILNLRQRSF